MGFFDSVIEQTIDLLKRDGELSSCRILKAHPDCFHQSPLSKVTVTVSLGGAQVASAAMGDFLGFLWQIRGSDPGYHSLVASVGGRRGGVGNGLQPVR